MDWKRLLEIIDRRFDESRCLKKISDMYETDRWFSDKESLKTADYCADTMRSMGLEEVEKLPLTADGKAMYGDWGMPKGWHCDHAVLRSLDGEVFADYSQMPCSLVEASGCTPEGGIEAAVVCVDDFTVAPEDESLRGKFLFIDAPAWKAAELAYKTGAAGIISESVPLIPGIRNTKEDFYDDCPWEGLGSEARYGVIAFKLTPRKAKRLHELMEKGPVRLFADVKTESFDGVLYTVSGALSGEDPSLPEVFGYGHLYEPGANDNASGSAALLELMECFSEAIAEGVLKRPKRTIRIAMGRECTGSMGYMCAHYPERKMLCGAVADMIGCEKLDNATNSLRYDPFANWAFTDAAIEEIDRMYMEYAGKEHDCRHQAFNIATDNIIADPVYDVPTFAMVAAPCLSYHSSMDRPDRIDKEFLKRNAVIIGTYLYGLADADEETCGFLEELIRKQTERKVAEESFGRRKKILKEAGDRALYSLRKICSDVTFERPAEEVEPMPEYAQAKGQRVPVRKVLGCLTFTGNMDLWKTGYIPAWNGKLNVPLFWADGKRNVWEIAYRTAVELRECSDEQIKHQYEYLTGYFELLVQNDFCAWR